MKKILGLTLVLLLGLVVLVACGGDQTATNEQTGENSDTVSAASINITDEAVFRKSIGEEGKWIICTVEDLTFDEELVVEGTFYNRGDSNNDVFRKIAPYEQDDNRNVTARYSITAPRMVIESPNTRFQAGTFVGDIYVEAEGFELVDARVEGDVIFASEEYESSADISDDSTVTGTIEVE
ncbi:MAG: hypothetical protein ACLFPF_05765 [Halanaerobiales bacterium]